MATARRRLSSDMDQFGAEYAPSDGVPTDEEVAEELLDEELLEEDEDGVIDIQQAHHTAPPPAPPGLKEISSLASWTVSSSKPGCGVAALRAPNTNLFWQSDGPQPHHLNIHFFKMVSIVGIRIFLDFDSDESYTPTLIKFLAGTGYNDLQEFAVMKFESPRGWMDVDFEGVGDPADANGEDDDESMSDGDEEKENLDRRRMPVLRAMLVQAKICENHQNGKDTHLRGLQIFAKDTAGKPNAATAVKIPEPAAAGPGAVPSKEELRRKRDEKMWAIPDWAVVDDIR